MKDDFYQKLAEALEYELAACDAIYNSGGSAERIELCAGFWADELMPYVKNEADLRALAKAFREHRRNRERRPALCHILELLPYCRDKETVKEIEIEAGARTPGKAAEVWEKVFGRPLK